MNRAIKVENLSKKYIIRHENRVRYVALRDVITNSAKNLGSRFLNPFSNQSKTNKTEGRIALKGRVSSLLEVGTGFHPELTGRENIYLNGAILGMSRAEINNKFNEIVEFAEVEMFLDTPVKRYSSGMQVRLAFAVAAHLEPEILLVEEVLAVGDAQFQKKCLGKMEEVAGEGRTIIFVSHNMGAIGKLCSQAMLLDEGRLICLSNNVGDTIKQYLRLGANQTINPFWENSENGFYNPYFRPLKIAVMNNRNSIVGLPMRNDEDVWLIVECFIETLDKALQIGFAIYSENEDMLFWSFHNDTNEVNWPKLNIGLNTVKAKLPKRLLNEGVYRIDLLAALYHREWLLKPGGNSPNLYLDIQGGLSDSQYWYHKRPGKIAPILKWEIDVSPVAEMED